MKRRLVIIAFFLLLGAVVNVAVAWGCAAWVRLTNDGTNIHRSCSRKNVPLWIFDVIERPGHRTTLVMLVRDQTLVGSNASSWPIATPALDAWMNQLNVSELGRHEKCSARFSALGWPLHSLWWGMRAFFDQFPAPPSEVLGGIPLPDFPARIFRQVQDIRFLPLRPIWSGFAVNTLFYAALVWLLICGPFALRRVWRRRRRLCPKCAYPMGESAVCTECGISLPRRLRMAILT